MIALSDQNGTTTITTPEKLGGASIMGSNQSGREIKTATIDAIFETKAIEYPYLLFPLIFHYFFNHFTKLFIPDTLFMI